MSGITLAVAQHMLDQYIAAEQALLLGKSTRMGEKWLEYADLDQVSAPAARTQEAQVQRLKSGVTARGPQIYGITPGVERRPHRSHRQRACPTSNGPPSTASSSMWRRSPPAVACKPASGTP